MCVSVERIRTCILILEVVYKRWEEKGKKARMMRNLKYQAISDHE